MTVEDAQRPGRKHQHAGHREQDAHQHDHQLAPLTLEARCEHSHQRRRERDAQQRDAAGHGQQQREHGTGHAAGFLGAAATEQLRVHRNERRAERALAQQVLQHVGHAQCGTEHIRMQTGTEAHGDQPFAHQPGNAAQEDAARHQHGCGAARCGPGRGFPGGR
jgi:hypothetical protein